ncbi:MAG: four helix bundle protein [Thermoanaerobaculia bacterium]
MSTKTSYRDLVVWQKAMDVSVQIYEVTSRFPNEERYGLSHQMRRAAVSIASNIAEGYGRTTHRQKYSFLENARGSAYELETQIELARRLGYDHDTLPALSVEIGLIGSGISSLMRYVERDSHDHTTVRP